MLCLYVCVDNVNYTLHYVVIIIMHCVLFCSALQTKLVVAVVAVWQQLSAVVVLVPMLVLQWSECCVFYNRTCGYTIYTGRWTQHKAHSAINNHTSVDH